MSVKNLLVIQTNILVALLKPITKPSVSCRWLMPIMLLASVGAQAQSQNEVAISVLYDGTSGFSTAAPDLTTPAGAAPEVHTPGSDGGANNLVIRTHDLFAVRVDWNINEDAAQDVTLVVVLPSDTVDGGTGTGDATWTPDSTGMFAGCEPATSTISADGYTLTCKLLDQVEGSNGTIRPVALFNEAFDNSTFDVTATLTTTADAAGVNDGLDQLLTVSEGPYVNYVKGSPEVSAVIAGDGSVDGYVALFPFTFLDFSQGSSRTGVGPINDSVAVQLYDHMWSLTPSVRLASAAEMTTAGFAGDVCGDYAQAGAYVGTLNGAWACDPIITTGAYPVVPVLVSGFTSRPAPTTLANGSANSANPQITSGQIALWLTKAEVDLAIADIDNAETTDAAQFFNALVEQDESTIITDSDDIIEANGQGTSGPAIQGSPSDNNTGLSFGEIIVPTGGGSGGVNVFTHDVKFEPGPLQLLGSLRYSTNDEPRYSMDVRSTATGGLGELTGASSTRHFINGNDLTGQVARSSTVTILAGTMERSSTGNAVGPVHGCVAFDTTHYSLVEFGDIIVNQVGDNTVNNAATVSSSIISSNTGSLAHMTLGLGSLWRPNNQRTQSGLGEAEFAYTVEFSNAPLQRHFDAADPADAGLEDSFGVEHDELTCDTADGGTTGWVDSSDPVAMAAAMAAFDSNGDGEYEGITRARYTATEGMGFEADDATNSGWRGMRVFFQALVKDDIDDQDPDQELFALASMSFGERDAVTGTPNLDLFDVGTAGTSCRPFLPGQWDNSGNDSASTTGWCGQSFKDDGVNSEDLTDDVDWDNSGSVLLNVISSGAMIKIVEANLSVSKTNLDGLLDIKNNGQLVQFSLSPSVVGANAEALSNVRMTDTLESRYEFVQFIQLPTTAGAFCTETSGTIFCRYSEVDPLVDTGIDPTFGDLPSGLPGGWPASSSGSSEVIIEVMVTGAVANSDSSTVLTNTTTVNSSGLGPWDTTTDEFTAPVTIDSVNKSKSNSAFSYMPLPADESVIAKSVNVLEGPCDVVPTSFSGTLVEWQARCSLIDINANMSFDLTLENEGNTALTQIEFVDVFPYVGDSAEEESNTPNQTGSTPTLGDGRSPASDFVGTLSFVGVTAVGDLPVGSTLVTWVSGDASADISRDPARSLTDNTWCDAPGGAVQNGGAGACPATAADVKAVYVLFDGGDGLLPAESATVRLELDSDGAECDDLWTNAFGARASNMELPIRSNDVSIMAQCVSLGSTVFHDANNNGLQDPTDLGIALVDVQLFLAGDDPTTATPVASAVTGAAGEYLFSAIPPGDYFVYIPTPPAAFSASSTDIASSGADNNVDGDDNGQQLVAGAPVQSPVISLSSGTEPTTGETGTNNAQDDDDAFAGSRDEDGDMTVDFGFYTPVAIGSVIWEDTNGDGVQDAGESPLTQGIVTLLDGNGVPVTVDAFGNPIAPIDLSASGGTYLFDNLPVGDYQIQVTGLADGYGPSPTQTTADNDDTPNDSNVATDSGTGTYTSGTFTLANGTEPTGASEVSPITTAGDGVDDADDANGNMTVDMGFVQTVSIGSVVWLDADGDGIQDATETLINEGTVRLLNADGTPVTDANGVALPVVDLSVTGGSYFFGGLLEGNYIVEVTPPAGFEQTPTQTTTDDSGANELDSNIASEAAGVFRSPVISLEFGSEVIESDVDGITGDGDTLDNGADTGGDMTIDFGFVQPVSIGSVVWEDTNGDGIQDATESLITQGIVTLLDGNGDPVTTDINGDPIDPIDLSATNGTYLFDNLPPGDYQIQVTALADGFGPSPVQNTADDDDTANDSNIADEPTPGTYVSGTFTLTSDGEPTGTDEASNLVGAGDDADDVNDDAGNMTVDFGFVQTVSIGSVVWLDANGDGVQDATESLVNEGTVQLLNADGSVATGLNGVAIAPIDLATGSNGVPGTYFFDNLPEGEYIVQVTPPAGYDQTPTQTTADDDGANELDSNIALETAPGVFQSPVIDLQFGDEVVEATGDGITGDGDAADAVDAASDAAGDMTVDFGFIQPVSIGSYVWQDDNGDGVQDASESGIAGATVVLLVDDGTGNFVPVTTDLDGNPIGVAGVLTTGADGLYEFDNLAPGNYKVQVTPPADYTATPTQTAGEDAIQNDSNIASEPSPGTYESGIFTLSSGGEPAETDAQAGDNQDGVAGSLEDLSGNQTIDFGFIAPISIGSYVWEDVNLDGVQDSTEPPIAGALVALLVDDGTGTFVPALDLNGDPVVAMTTGVDGLYEFGNLPPGDYKVQVTPPAGYLASPTQTVADDDDAQDDSNIASEPSTGTFESGVFTLTSGGEPSETDTAAGDSQDGVLGSAPDLSGNMTIDFGFVAPLSVGSLVWEDTNADGIQDANEPPIAGTQVTLLVDDGTGTFVPATDINGNPVAAVTTGPDGLYNFENLPQGNYVIEVTPPAGLFPSPVQSTSDDDVSNDSNIADEPTPGTYASAPFVLDSFTESTETGTERGDDQDDGLDSNGNMTIDFGFIPPASLGNYVWLDLDMDGVQDANEDGIANVTVNLYADTDGDGVISGAELTTPIATATTGPNGEYLFPDLEPGVVYQTGVDVATLPAGLVQTFDEGDGVGATDSLSDPIILDPNEFHDTADFGYAPPAGLGAVGDTIWIDADDDGVQDPGEPGIAGVTVTLTPAPDVDLGAGPGVAISTVTDANGKYLFPNLPLDQAYVVEVDITTLPAGYVSGPSNLGDPDVRDGNSSVADNSTIVVLTPDDPINLDLDFGYLPPEDQNNSIGDTLWIDVDEDGNGPAGAGDESDVTELPIAGVTVSLIDTVTGNVIATTTTDANGMYLFTGIPDGTYEVQVTDQNNVLAGLEPTADGDDPANPGAFVALTPNASVVDLDSGSTSATPIDDLDQDFGYVDSNTAGGDGSIGDTIFFDADNSGTPESGEGLEGVVVELFGPGPDGVIGGGDDVLLATTTTDENGNYLFTGLDTSDADPANPGSGTEYQVVVDTSTLPNGGAGWDNTVDPDTAGMGDSESVTTLTATDPIDLDQDFGYLGTDNNTLSGTLWPDSDGNGMQDEAGEFAGVTIEIRDENGNVIRKIETDADGNYEVSNLPDGIYTVVVTDENNVLNGFAHTDSPNGTSDTSDQTSKDDTGYTVDLDSVGAVDTPVTDETGDFGYEPSVTNPISLGSFLASSTSDGHVTIDWATQTEVANLGFHLYAQVDDQWVQLNEVLILSQGDSVSVQSYSATFEIDALVDTKMFAISDIDLTGKETLHGPYTLGQMFGVISDRQVIDWESEKAEREDKQARRDAQRLEQQQTRMQSLQKQMGVQ